MSNPSIYFNRFDAVIDPTTLPSLFTNPFNYIPNPVCLRAVELLQSHLQTQTVWSHNFGLSDSIQDSTIVGKMFGVLVVKNEAEEIGYLAAFSGKLANGNHHAHFVPPVFDIHIEGDFLNIGMIELSRINAEIDLLETNPSTENTNKITLLKSIRKKHSNALQEEIFNRYFFLNQAGEEKSLTTIFTEVGRSKPPSGAGECAAPKLLQHAFLHNMKPIAMAEFWWGQSPKSTHWKHQHFYPSCQEKCAPILAHMLKDIELEK